MGTEQVNNIFDTNSLVTAFGVTPSELFAAIVIVSVMVLGFWGIVKYNSRDRFADPRLIGSKGGKVKKTTIEHDGDPDDL